MAQALSTLFRPFLRDRFLHFLLLLGLVLSCFHPEKVPQFANFVDWNTIVTLLGLLMLTKGVEISGYFDFVGRKMINAIDNERRLALFLVSAAAVLSTFMTNDVALFIVIPLTITLKKLTSLPVTRLIIFEALAVNAGSLLTPIGNPQNILLWRNGGLGFVEFIWQMLPLAALLLVSLLLLTVCCFPSRTIERHADRPEERWQRPLLFSSVALYVLFIAALEQDLAIWGLGIVFVAFLLLARRILLTIDWSLLVVFIAMFVDVFLLTRLPLLQSSLHAVGQLPQFGQFMLAAGLSQIISNVPTTILLLTTLPPSVLLAWAVNIGGFGLLPGSLANLIALRMAKDRRIWWHFHLYSIPMLLWALGSGWLLYLTFRAA